MLVAFSYPVGLFLVLPFLAVGAMGGPAAFVGLFLVLLILLVPIVIVGLLLSPWAGSKLPAQKLPSFVMAGSAAVAPAIGFWLSVGGSGGGLVVAWAFLALPASALGAILFIGGCERRRARSAPPIDQ